MNNDIINVGTIIETITYQNQFITHGTPVNQIADDLFDHNENVDVNAR
jgi:hypothetical protein